MAVLCPDCNRSLQINTWCITTPSVRFVINIYVIYEIDCPNCEFRLRGCYAQHVLLNNAEFSVQNNAFVVMRRDNSINEPMEIDNNFETDFREPMECDD